MVNKGAVTGSVNCGGSYTIPAGYHNGSGKITGNSLASQTGVQSGKTAAGAGQILTGYEAWVNGGRVTGTMANQGAKTSSLNCGGSYTIPAGYHNGSGKITANSLSSQTSANAAANHLAKDKTAWVNGSKITGTVPDKRGTAQPVQYAQIRNNRFEIAVEPGIYGCNWVNNAQDYEYLSYQKVRDTIGLTAAKLKHNEGVLGLTGTFTSDANLEAGCLLSGYSGYSKGSKINGTMANRAITDSTIGGINSSYPTVAIHKGANPQFNTSTKSGERLFGIAPPSGYYNGAPYVGCPAQTKTVTPTASTQTIRADGGKVLEQVTVNGCQIFKQYAGTATSNNTKKPYKDMGGKNYLLYSFSIITQKGFRPMNISAITNGSVWPKDYILNDPWHIILLADDSSLYYFNYDGEGIQWGNGEYSWIILPAFYGNTPYDYVLSGYIT